MLNEHNTVFASKRSAVRAQAVYFLHSTMRSVTCLRLSDVSVICRVTYFQFPIQSAFLPYIGRQAAPALRHILVLIRNIGHRTLPKIWVGTFLGQDSTREAARNREVDTKFVNEQ